jgi:hypothetical protein|tara:strand:+ start:361 stop:534 length:174 start_codon:yes stop_codon:yes gene_type:complete
MNWDIVFNICILLWVIFLQFQSYDTRRSCDIDRLDKQDIADAIGELKKKVKSRKSKK